jgi:hypothetical protein
MKKESDKIELRSEKMRNLIGKIPTNLTHWGTIVIILVSLELLATSAFFKYPDHHGVQKTLIERIVQRFTLTGKS